MKSFSLFIVATIATCSALRAADEKRMTVVEYYLLLPEKAFEARPRAWLQDAKVIGPLLAICEGELEGNDSMTLNFYGHGADGRMHKAPEISFQLATPGVKAAMNLSRKAGTLSFQDMVEPFWCAV